MIRLLIVSFTFPPYSGIGGRRWVKFSKYLNKNGVDCRVIAAKKDGLSDSQWNNDLQSEIPVLYEKMTYPTILMTRPDTVFQKIRYRLALIKVKSNYKNQNFYDYSIGFGKKILPLIKKEINNGVNNILVTVGPFHMAAEIIEVKKYFPHVNFIVDFRDPWSNNQTSFGFSGLNDESLKYEQDLEKFVLREYDTVFAVSEEMKNHFKHLLSAGHEKCVTLPNGFDPHDYNKIHVLEQDLKKTDKIIFSFSGTLYNKTEIVFTEFVQALDQIRVENIEIYNRLEFNFMGEIPSWFQEITHNHQIIRYSGIKKFNDAIVDSLNADYSMLFLTDDLKYSKSTKFYEAIALRKPIIVFSEPGPTTDFVEKNKIGFGIYKGTIKKRLLELISHELTFNKELDINEYSIENLTKKIIPYLKPN